MTRHPVIGGMLVATILLGGCAEPAFRTDPAEAAAHTVMADAFGGIQEPGPHEVVVMINGNAFKGVHAGMFAGGRLYDPSGTYVGKRSEDRSWRKPSLADYVAFQLMDGPDVRLYRFQLDKEDFAGVLDRIEHAGRTMPIYCAVSVRDVLAGIGPFRGIERDGWISPKRLATLLGPAAAALGQAQTTTTVAETTAPVPSNAGALNPPTLEGP